MKPARRSCGDRPRLKVVLLESPIETVPPQLWNHPQVLRAARRYSLKPAEMLLDKTLHYHAMEKLPQKWKRGRPDIVHTVLLVLQDSLLNQMHRLQVYIHVYDGRVFHVSPETRIPKHYERFRGLMAQLLRENQVPPGSDNPLISLEAETLRGFTARHGKLVLLDEKGQPATAAQAVRISLQACTPVGIGMFPRGDFRATTRRKAWLRLSLAQGRPLKAWTVASRIVSEAENLLSLTW